MVITLAGCNRVCAEPMLELNSTKDMAILVTPGRRDRTVTGAHVLAAVVGVGAALALLSLVGGIDQSVGAPPAQQVFLPTNSTQGFELLGGQTYSYVTESLFGKHTSLNYSYRGVVFEFHLWCWITVDVGWVCGHAIEPGGASYAYNFSDGLPMQNPPWQNWIAPDFHEAVQYQQGGSARLCVAA